jgi:signal transduction histidine kinase
VRGFVVVGGLALGYVIAFVVLQPRIGDPVLALSMIPMVVAAWLYGIRGGIVAGVITVALNITLMQTIGDHDGFRAPQLPRIAVALGIAAAAGWARDITRRQRELLDQIEHAANALREAKDQLEDQVAARTAELARTNAALEAENAARRRDLEARKQLEAHAAAADRMAVVGTLTAGIGHEINNPLAVILANLSYVTEHLPEDVEPAVREALHDAQASARRAGEIIQNMRVFVQTTSTSEHADVRRVVNTTVQMVANEIRHHARLEVDVDDTPPAALPESQLGQLLLNLLTNAAHALRENADNEVRVEVRAGAGKVTIRVSDTGGGIPAEAQARIFEPFFTTKPIGVGTGLGLWVCHHIVTSAGGEITLERSSDAGTTFRIDLPVARASQMSLPTLPAPLGSLRGRVLVIDDDSAIRRSISRFIKNRHDLTVVDSGEAALELIEGGQRFDVILCDMMMPEMDGAELFTQLEAVAPTQATRIIFMTGGAFTPRTKSFLEPLRNRLLEKPFEAVQLEAKIQELLQVDAAS